MRKFMFGAMTAISMALTVAGSGVALADSANWDAAKAGQIAVNRCADAGIGNGGESLRRGNCVGVRSESAFRDIDPGNSGAHNANND